MGKSEERTSSQKFSSLAVVTAHTRVFHHTHMHHFAYRIPQTNKLPTNERASANTGGYHIGIIPQTAWQHHGVLALDVQRTDCCPHTSCAQFWLCASCYVRQQMLQIWSPRPTTCTGRTVLRKGSRCGAVQTFGDCSFGKAFWHFPTALLLLSCWSHGSPGSAGSPLTLLLVSWSPSCL